MTLDDPADYAVEGSVVRVMWDYDVPIPLWDAVGLLPEDPVWLRETLELSEQLIRDLFRWCSDMSAATGPDDPYDPPRSPPFPRSGDKKAVETLTGRGRELAQQLQRELGPRFSVEYRPW